MSLAAKLTLGGFKFDVSGNLRSIIYQALVPGLLGTGGRCLVGLNLED